MPSSYAVRNNIALSKLQVTFIVVLLHGIVFMAPVTRGFVYCFIAQLKIN
jgi:hypothetical protein